MPAKLIAAAVIVILTVGYFLGLWSDLGGWLGDLWRFLAASTLVPNWLLGFFAICAIVVAGLLGAIGLSSMTAGLVLTALLPPNPSSADIMWRLVLCGAGFGVFASPNNRLMMNAVPRERSGSAGGIIATARTLGQTMGAALVAVVFGLFDFSSGGAADAARAAIWLGAGFAGAALVIGSLRLRH